MRHIIYKLAGATTAAAMWTLGAAAAGGHGNVRSDPPVDHYQVMQYEQQSEPAEQPAWLGHKQNIEQPKNYEQPKHEQLSQPKHEEYTQPKHEEYNQPKHETYQAPVKHDEYKPAPRHDDYQPAPKYDEYTSAPKHEYDQPKHEPKHDFDRDRHDVKPVNVHHDYDTNKHYDRNNDRHVDYMRHDNDDKYRHHDTDRRDYDKDRHDYDTDRHDYDRDRHDNDFRHVVITHRDYCDLRHGDNWNRADWIRYENKDRCDFDRDRHHDRHDYDRMHHDYDRDRHDYDRVVYLQRDDCNRYDRDMHHVSYLHHKHNGRGHDWEYDRHMRPAHYTHHGQLLGDCDFDFGSVRFQAKFNELRLASIHYVNSHRMNLRDDCRRDFCPVQHWSCDMRGDRDHFMYMRA